jgi:AcrR family transcriptional regulator
MTDRKTRSLEAVIEEARRQFAARPFDQVSIADIASAAHCSTTTIYDVYGNKDGLYFAAAQSFLTDYWAETAALRRGDTALERMVTLMEARAERFSAPELREALRNLVARVGTNQLRSTPLIRSMLTSQLSLLTELTHACVAEGAFVNLPSGLLVETLIASVDWRPVMHGLLYGANDPLNFPVPIIVARALITLLTPHGRAAYDALRPGLLHQALAGQSPILQGAMGINS